MQEAGWGGPDGLADLSSTSQRHCTLVLIEERIHHPPLPLICLIPLLVVIVAPCTHFRQLNVTFYFNLHPREPRAE